MTSAFSTPDGRGPGAILDAADACVSRHLAFLAELDEQRREAVEALELDLAAARAVSEAELVLARAAVARDADLVLAAARDRAAELEAEAAAEVERRLEWARAQARTILRRAREVQAVNAAPVPVTRPLPPRTGVAAAQPLRPPWWYDDARPFDD